MRSDSVWLLASPTSAKTHFRPAFLDFEVIVFFGDQSFFPFLVGSLLMLNVIFKMVILPVSSGKFSYNIFFFSLPGIQIPDSFSRFDMETFQAASKIKYPSSLVQSASLNSYLGLHPNSAACAPGAVPAAWLLDPRIVHGVRARCLSLLTHVPRFSSDQNQSQAREASKHVPRFCPHTLGR